jgi:hypothetical protein
VDFAANQIVVRVGKGDRDRVTMLPAAVKTELVRHLELVKSQHDADLRREPAGWSRPGRSPGSTRTPGASGYGSGDAESRSSGSPDGVTLSGRAASQPLRCSSDIKFDAIK